jgi:DNA-binding LacI/PurR family transcriptional regulator
MTPPKPKGFVSAQQVADRAGVSRSAVSRSFTPGASVAEATRRKVIQAAEELGYHVNHLARSLIRDRSGIVCIIAADVNSPYQSTMLATLTRRLQEINRVALVVNSSGESESVAGALGKTLNYRAEATVVLSGTPAASLIQTCVNSGQHVILVNRDDRYAGCERILVDNVRASREALAMLRRAGCRRIAVVSSLAGTTSLTMRERAFAEAAAGSDAEVTVIRSGPTAYRSGAEAARTLLSGSGRPDAAFCVTDLLACGFMDAARHEFGMSVPDDLCVIGFDDIEQAGWASYNLTTFRQPAEGIAGRICALIDDSDGTDAPSEPIYLEAEPIWRRSVRAR